MVRTGGPKWNIDQHNRVLGMIRLGFLSRSVGRDGGVDRRATSTGAHVSFHVDVVLITYMGAGQN